MTTGSQFLRDSGNLKSKFLKPKNQVLNFVTMKSSIFFKTSYVVKYL